MKRRARNDLLAINKTSSLGNQQLGDIKVHNSCQFGNLPSPPTNQLAKSTPCWIHCKSTAGTTHISAEES